MAESLPLRLLLTGVQKLYANQSNHNRRTDVE
jgi:hypothetical protein